MSVYFWAICVITIPGILSDLLNNEIPHSSIRITESLENYLFECLFQFNIVHNGLMRKLHRPHVCCTRLVTASPNASLRSSEGGVNEPHGPNSTPISSEITLTWEVCPFKVSPKLTIQLNRISRSSWISNALWGRFPSATPSYTAEVTHLWGMLSEVDSVEEICSIYETTVKRLLLFFK